MGRALFVQRNRAYTYAEIAQLVAEIERELPTRGIVPSSRVVVVADYSPEVFCLLLALARQSCCIIPLTRSSIVEETDALSICGCDHYLSFDASGEHFSASERSVQVTQPMLEQLRSDARPGLVLFSSGSTARPKAILHDFARVADKFRAPRAPVVAILFLILDHFGGINTLLAITSSLGTVVSPESRTVDGICEAIARHRVELLPTTPSFLSLLVASNVFDKYDLSSLRRITYGTETMPQPTLERVRARFPQVELQQTYGLSEVGVLRSQSRPDGSLWVRVGSRLRDPSARRYPLGALTALLEGEAYSARFKKLRQASQSRRQ